jgi:uncharacterized protein
VNENMPSSEMALKFLSDAGCSESVISHCKAVSALAVKYARFCKSKGLTVDINLVKIGALLHDIGRSTTHNVTHAVAGVKIAKSLKLSEDLVSIIESHIGGGITATEAKKLGLPIKDYFPQTLEEKLVAYADKRIKGSNVVPIEQTIEEFSMKLGKNHPSVERITRLHEELSPLIGDMNDKSNNS